MAGFSGRAQIHDEVAVPIVAECFKRYGFECFMMGTEGDTKELRAALMSQYDRTSVMLRFRPDRVFIKVGQRSVLCEVKSEDKGYPNFAIEIDSYKAALEWNTTGQHVMYGLVDLSNGQPSVYSCWVGDIPTPRVIAVPERWDHQETMGRLRVEWPGVRLDLTPYRPGKQSGTPFFLIPKRSNFLVPFDAFVTWFVLQSQLEMTF